MQSAETLIWNKWTHSQQYFLLTQYSKQIVDTLISNIFCFLKSETKILLTNKADKSDRTNTICETDKTDKIDKTRMKNEWDFDS